MEKTAERVLDIPTLATFEKSYHWWNMTHAAAVTLFVAGSQIPAIALPSSAALAIWVAVALPLLFVLGYRLHPDGAGPSLPNALTASRALSAVVLLSLVGLLQAGFVSQSVLQGTAAWWMAAGLGVITLTDFFDGRIARRMRAGRFGETWDMECDAAFALGLSLLLRTIHSVPLFVLAIGLMRYLYVLLWRYDCDPADVPRAYKLYAKTVTALLVTGLIVSLVPVIPSTARVVLLSVLLTLQVISFLWDLILQRRARS
jgi:phosphatidylglycerophosphate synthase